MSTSSTYVLTVGDPAYWTAPSLTGSPCLTPVHIVDLRIDDMGGYWVRFRTQSRSELVVSANYIVARNSVKRRNGQRIVVGQTNFQARES